MKFNDIWNYIVKHYKENYNSPESVLQKSWEQFFSELFDYRFLFGEIDSHRTIHIGSSKRTIPDIIIKKDGSDLFDVELKQYNLPFSIEMEEQLKSYMDLLHIQVGILVCQKLYVYIYNFAQKKFKKLEILFTEDNSIGIEFVEIFQKENFSIEKIEKFIDKKNSFSNNISKIKNELTEQKIVEIAKEYFCKLYSEEEVSRAFDQIFIEVKTKNEKPVVVYTHNESSKGFKPDTTKYIFEGKVYGKGRLVLAVVKAYVRDNPSITVSTLKTVFYDRLQGSTGVLATPIEAKLKRTDFNNRYFIKDSINVNGEVIWVCSQWGIGNIDNFIGKVISLGYTITKEN